MPNENKRWMSWKICSQTSYYSARAYNMANNVTRTMAKPPLILYVQKMGSNILALMVFRHLSILWIMMFFKISIYVVECVNILNLCSSSDEFMVTYSPYKRLCGLGVVWEVKIVVLLILHDHVMLYNTCFHYRAFQISIVFLGFGLWPNVPEAHQPLSPHLFLQPRLRDSWMQ